MSRVLPAAVTATAPCLRPPTILAPALLTFILLTPGLLVSPAAHAQYQPPPPQAPITATPLLPPTSQYPTLAPPQGLPQVVQPTPAQALPSGPSQPAAPPSAAAPSGTTSPGAIPFGGQSAPAPTLAPVQQPAIQQPTVQQPTVQQPATQQPTAQQPAAPGQPPTTEPPPPPPNPWLPQATAVLQALDKINAQTMTLTVKTGQTATFGSLSIAVQACAIRPPDMPQDATAYLTITDSHPDQPGFRGWVLKSDPSLSMLEHPIYDVRVVGCAP